jgi:hypothetical protein
VPVTYRPRGVDDGKKLSPSVGWSVLRVIVRERFAARTPTTAPVNAGNIPD